MNGGRHSFTFAIEKPTASTTRKTISHFQAFCLDHNYLQRIQIGSMAENVTKSNYPISDDIHHASAFDTLNTALSQSQALPFVSSICHTGLLVMKNLKLVIISATLTYFSDLGRHFCLSPFPVKV